MSGWRGDARARAVFENKSDGKNQNDDIVLLTALFTNTITVRNEYRYCAVMRVNNNVFHHPLRGSKKFPQSTELLEMEIQWDVLWK